MKDHIERVVKVEKVKDERRKKTMESMGGSATSEMMRELLDDAMGSAMDGLILDGTAEEKLQQIMTRAKESGMTVEKIFSYFKLQAAHDPKTAEVEKGDLSREEFQIGLERLGEGFLNLTFEELSELIKVFDVDGDGAISVSEFKLYCYYKIPAVCWRAERRRVEASGEMDALRAVLNGTANSHHYEQMQEDAAHHGLDKHEEKIVQISCGPIVYQTTKLFWRTNTTVDIKFYFCQPLGVITVQVFNQSEDKEVPSLYVSIHDIEISAETTIATMKKEISASNAKTEEQKKKVGDDAKWTLFAEYILARLKLPDTSNPFPVNEMRAKLPPLTPRSESIMPFLCKLSDDQYKGESLMIAKPLGIEPPPAVPREIVVSVDDFHKALAELNDGHRDARVLRSSAASMSKLLELSMNAFANAEQDVNRRRLLSASKRGWIDTLTKYVVKKQAEAVRAVLATSPAYAALLEEQKAKKEKVKAEAAAAAAAEVKVDTAPAVPLAAEPATATA
jgi:hypothetical protein